MSSPCILILDLVNGYIAADFPNMPGGGGALLVRIEYGRFSIHAYSIDSVPVEVHFYIGIPGGAIMRAYPPGTPYDLIFVGLASFYNRMEYVPWW